MMRKKRWVLCAVALVAVGFISCGKDHNVPDGIKPEGLFGEYSNADHDAVQDATNDEVDRAADSTIDSAADCASDHASDNAESMDFSVETEENPPWKEAYKTLIGDWKLIENYGDFSYLEFYFGSEGDYAFDSYWLCDVDQNGIPELFLFSRSMIGMTAVFTYADGPIFLEYDCIDGINPETAEIVIHGHWHGAGGSWDNEWIAYQVQGDRAKYNVYIDYFELDEGERAYTVYDPATDTYNKMDTGEKYDEEYAVHVVPRISVEEYVKYELSDASGLDDIQ